MEEYEKALKISKTLFSGNIKELSLEELKDGFKGVPTFEFNTNETLIDILINNNIASSKREAREFINAGSITVNGDKITNETELITTDKLINNEILIIRKGKKKYYNGILKK